jgi:hypothetical protein
MARLIEQVPNEIWDVIVQAACIDGGNTGCALSLVSKHIRAISHLSRLQSAALDGVKDMRSFVRELQRRQVEENAVRFLYLTDTTPLGTGDVDYIGEDNDDTDVDEIRGDQWRTVYAQLINLISATIEVLTIDVDYHWTERLQNVFPLVNPHVPRLRSLTASGVGLINLGCSFASMPSLRHLHLFSGIGYCLSNDPFCNILLRQTPALSHLRISDFSQDLTLVKSLGRLLGIPEYNKVTNRSDMAHGAIVAKDMASNTNLELGGNGAVEDGAPVNFLPLCVLIIEPAALSMGGWCGTSYIMNGEMLGQIEDLVAKYDGYRQVRIVSLQGSDSDTDVGCRELRRAWEEVVAGGLGLWAVRDDHV